MIKVANVITTCEWVRVWSDLTTIADSLSACGQDCGPVTSIKNAAVIAVRWLKISKAIERVNSSRKSAAAVSD